MLLRPLKSTLGLSPRSTFWPPLFVSKKSSSLLKLLSRLPPMKMYRSLPTIWAWMLSSSEPLACSCPPLVLFPKPVLLVCTASAVGYEASRVPSTVCAQAAVLPSSVTAVRVASRPAFQCKSDFIKRGNYGGNTPPAAKQLSRPDGRGEI